MTDSVDSQVRLAESLPTGSETLDWFPNLSELLTRDWHMVSAQKTLAPTSLSNLGQERRIRTIFLTLKRKQRKNNS